MNEATAKRPHHDLSPSAIRMYQACPLQYKFKYVEKKQGLPPGEPLMAGRLVHEVLAETARRAAISKTDSVTRAGLIQILGQLLKDEKHAKLIPFQEAATATLNNVKSLPLPPVIERIIEYPWYMKVDDIVVHGYCDRVDIRQTGQGPIAEIIDYKSGRATEDDMVLDPQAGLYLASGYQSYPDVIQIEFTLWYLSSGGTITTEWTPELEAFALELVRGTWRGIQAAKFDATPGEPCNWCDYRVECPALADMLAGVEPPAGVALTDKQADSISDPEPRPPDKDLSDDDLLKERDRAAVMAKVFERRRKDCDKVIIARIGEEGKSLQAGRLTGTITNRRINDVDTAVISELAQLLGRPMKVLIEGCCTISRPRLLLMVEGNPEAEQLIENRTSLNHTTYITMRKRKEAF